jgi:hypothetical protein
VKRSLASGYYVNSAANFAALLYARAMIALSSAFAALVGGWYRVANAFSGFFDRLSRIPGAVWDKMLQLFKQFRDTFTRLNHRAGLER